MNDTSQQMIEALDARVERRNERREFFKTAFGAVAIAAAGAGAVGLASRAVAQAATDADILNFALNLEYLEAQFYSYAVYGDGLAPRMLTGSGRQGMVRPGRKVNFTDPVVAAYAREIAEDEVNHVNFLRSALGSAAVAMPSIDVSAEGAFTDAARAAKVIGMTDTFDPYASDENFLLGAFIFEDVGVTAYKGASPLLSSKVYLEAAAGILAVEAYHAAIVRTTLYAKGMDTAALLTDADKISDKRDMLDGAPKDDATVGIGADDDQGISPVNDPTYGLMSNVAPLNENGLAYSRTVQQVHNIVYLTPDAASMGGFFPNGTNGTLTTSGDSSTY